jgi:hypothetical protein
MTVHLYTLCWNEADMLGFFFRHYDPWVDRYVVFDDGSTDGSLDILRGHPKVELRRFERVVSDSFVLSHQRLQNEVWKESRGNADWVVITAVDEHLRPAGGQNPGDYLAVAAGAGITAIPCLGFQMISHDLPDPGETLARTRTRGAPYHMMNKLSLFDPEAIRETNFTRGRHKAQPTATVVYPPRDELMLLHYKFIGFEQTLRRLGELHSGLGSRDVENRWGGQYQWSESRLRDAWQIVEERAVDTGAPGFTPWTTAPVAERWWRPPGFVDPGPAGPAPGP